LRHQLLIDFQHRFAFGGINQKNLDLRLQFYVGWKPSAASANDASFANALANGLAVAGSIRPMGTGEGPLHSQQFLQKMSNVIAIGRARRGFQRDISQCSLNHGGDPLTEFIFVCFQRDRQCRHLTLLTKLLNLANQ
jgi:hypothetical protein